MLIVCPSGLSFEARRWKVEDRKTLLDRKDARPVARRMLELVAGVVEDPGPYAAFAQGKRPNFLGVANVDIVGALFDLRLQGKPMYYYDRWCERCGAQLQLQQDLSLLPKKPLSEDALAHLKTGIPVVRRYGDVEIGIRLTLGSDLPKLEAATVLAEQLTLNTVMHIAYVQQPGAEGESVEQIADFGRIRQWYEGQDDWAMLQQLDRDIEVIEGGIDLGIRQRCANDGCRAELSFQLPLDVGFFVPSMEPRR